MDRMLRRSRLVTSVLAMLAFLPAAAPAADPPKKQDPKPAAPKKQGPTWLVIQIGSELQVARSDQIADMRKALEKENEKGAKLAAVSVGSKKFVPKTLSIVKDNFKSEKEADAFAKKYREDLLAKKRAQKVEKAKAEKKAPEPPKKAPDEVDL